MSWLSSLSGSLYGSLWVADLIFKASLMKCGLGALLKLSISCCRQKESETKIFKNETKNQQNNKVNKSNKLKCTVMCY